MKYVLIFCFTVGLFGCASIPPSTIPMAGHLYDGIAEARKTRHVLIDRWAKSWEDYINLRLYEVWFIDYIKDFAKDTGIAKDIKKAGGYATLKGLRALRDFAVAAADEYMIRHRVRMEALRVAERELRRQTNVHYDGMLQMILSIKTNLEAVEDSKAAQREIAQAIAPKVVDAFDEADRKLNEIIKEIENVTGK